MRESMHSSCIQKCHVKPHLGCHQLQESQGFLAGQVILANPLLQVDLEAQGCQVLLCLLHLQCRCVHLSAYQVRTSS